MARVGSIGVQPQHSVALYRELFPEVADRVRFLPVPVSAPVQTAGRGSALGSPMLETRTRRASISRWQPGTRAKPTERLVVTGIGTTEAREFLDARSIPIPSNVEFAGRIPSSEHRSLTQRAAVFVSSSRREEYGNAQLEALADGAILVSGPAPARLSRGRSASGSTCVSCPRGDTRVGTVHRARDRSPRRRASRLSGRCS